MKICYFREFYNLISKSNQCSRVDLGVFQDLTRCTFSASWYNKRKLYFNFSNRNTVRVWQMLTKRTPARRQLMSIVDSCIFKWNLSIAFHLDSLKCQKFNYFCESRKRKFQNVLIFNKVKGYPLTLMLKVKRYNLKIRLSLSLIRSFY